MTNLSPQQTEALTAIADWHSSQADQHFGADVFKLFGAAGCGKTTLARELPEALALDRVMYLAYTGKAAHVLRSKGCSPAATIHSSIYMPTADEEARRKLVQAEETLAEVTEEWREATSYPGGGSPDVWGPLTAQKEELEATITELQAQCRRTVWEWNPLAEVASADLIVLDEVSMVDAKMASDLEAYEVPILVLGDPAQLEPIQGEGYYTATEPDFMLTEVHRQALESPVLELATRIRQSTDARLGMTAGDVRPASLAEAMDHDQVLCWTNKRRWAMVDAIRHSLGRERATVAAGDRVMCLTNNRDLAVFNGQQFEVLGVRPGTLGPTLILRDDAGAERVIPAFQDGFEGREMQDQAKESGAGRKGGRMLATFAQAITVHKAQGSEWGSVYVVDETPSMIAMTERRKGRTEALEQARRWAYTAVSRASERVTVTAQRGGRR